MSEQEQPILNAASLAENSPAKTPPSQDPYAAVVLPENSSVDPQTLEAFKQAAAELNLPPQTLEKWVEAQEKCQERLAQQCLHEKEQQQQQWIRQTQEIFGPGWQEEVSKAVRAADAFGGPQLRALLEETGLGNHPVMVRTFHAVALGMSEDVTPGGSVAATTDKTFTQALYGKN